MRKIRHLKIFLLIAAVLLTVGIFWWAGPGPQEELMRRLEGNNTESQFPSQPRGEDLENLADSAELVMEGPRFFGSDKRGRRWEVRAHEARQKGGEGSSVELLEVAAETGESEDLITLNAVRGIYQQGGNRIDLLDGVTVMGHGHILTTSEVNYDMEDRLLRMPNRLTVHGPIGSVEAAQGEARNNGMEMTLTGGVRMHFNAKNEAAKSEGE